MHYSKSIALQVCCYNDGVKLRELQTYLLLKMCFK